MPHISGVSFGRLANLLKTVTDTAISGTFDDLPKIIKAKLRITPATSSDQVFFPIQSWAEYDGPGNGAAPGHFGSFLGVTDITRANVTHPWSVGVESRAHASGLNSIQTVCSLFTAAVQKTSEGAQGFAGIAAGLYFPLLDAVTQAWFGSSLRMAVYNADTGAQVRSEGPAHLNGGIFANNVEVVDLNISSGYIVLSDGVTKFAIQFGLYSGGAHGPTITFPVAFSSVKAIMATPVASGGAQIYTTLESAGNSSFKGMNYDENGSTGTNNFYWLAVGQVA